jgi:hypothetical protein
MPNWCSCDLDVTGPQAERDKLVEAARSKEAVDGKVSVLDASNFIPYPKKFRDQDEVARAWDKAHKDDRPLSWRERPKDGFNSGGYEWCIENWGTKWNFCRATVVSRIEEVVFGFETAWSPPIPVIEKMSAMFPKLGFKLRYFEGGMQFQGKCIFKGGEMVNELTGSYSGNRGG